MKEKDFFKNDGYLDSCSYKTREDLLVHTSQETLPYQIILN